MRNPWLKKNPLLSMWLSGANTVMSHARVQARRASTTAAKKATRDAVTLWTSAWMPAPPKPRRRKRR